METTALRVVVGILSLLTILQQARIRRIERLLHFTEIPEPPPEVKPPLPANVVGSRARFV